MDWGQIFNQSASSIISTTTIAYALAALGLGVHFGQAGLLNMGVAGFMAVGAYGYAISILTFGFPWWLAAIVALLAAVVHTPDVVGARALVLLGGAALLLAARSYRHRAARALLRLAGLGVWVALLVDLAASLQAGAGLLVGASAVAVGLALVAAAVATGRGWRSAWWSRRAEVLEGLAGAFALAALVPATGLFRLLWENVPDV